LWYVTITHLESDLQFHLKSTDTNSPDHPSSNPSEDAPAHKKGSGRHALDSDQLLNVVRSFLLADKPEAAAPIDILQTVRYLVFSGAEQASWVSQSRLAKELGCASETTIASSQKRLKEEFGWLSIKSGKRSQRTNLVTVDLRKLPQAKMAREVIDPQAAEVAKRYANALRNPSIRKKQRLDKKWEQRAALAIQYIMRTTGCDIYFVADLLAFAFDSMKWHGTAIKGPSAFKKKAILKQLLGDFAFQKASAATQTATPAPVQAPQKPAAPKPTPAPTYMDSITESLPGAGAPAAAPSVRRPYAEPTAEDEF
jgi:hypothetical protein